jgi:hypothetical protein
MGGRGIVGICHICGRLVKLSFEHVPPRSAFNDKPIHNANVRKFLETPSFDDLDKPGGRQQQRGAGAYTLCESCNSKTGHWYGSAYVDWACQAAHLLSRASNSSLLYYLFHLFPLRVIKQVVCMFLSSNPPSFRNAHVDLVKFVLNRDWKYLDPKVRIYAFYTMGDKSRRAGVTGMLRLNESRTGVAGTYIFSEIAFRPFGFVMAMNSPALDSRLVDISYFSQYGYNEWRDEALRLPLLPVYSVFPGDYRSREQIMTDVGAQ